MTPKPNWLRSVEASRSQMDADDLRAMDEYLEREKVSSDTQILDWMDDQFMVSISHHSQEYGQCEMGIPKRYNLREEVIKQMKRLE